MSEYAQRFLIVIIIFLVISMKFQMWEIEKDILIQNERTNKIVQRNHELYLKVLKENIRLNKEIADYKDEN